jgi:hypothetical protein
MSACGSSDEARTDHDTPPEGGAGGEGADAGAPSTAGNGATSGTGGTEPAPEGGTAGAAQGGAGNTSGTAQAGEAGSPDLGGAGGSANPSAWVVEAKYPTNGSYWLDYVKNDGADSTNATDVACAPTTDGPTYTACIHGGEIRRVALPGRADCTNLAASDALSAFDWKCQVAGAGVEIVSTGLASGKHMSDLIDFAGNGWKPNSVTVTLNGDPIGATEAAAWWANPIARLAGSMCTADVGAEHSIFTLDAASSNANCTGATGKIGLATVPGETVTDFRFHNRGHFNWYEGAYTQQAIYASLGFDNGGGFHVVRNASFTAAAAGTGTNVTLALGQIRASVVRDITATRGRIVIGAGSAVGLSISDVTSNLAGVDAISLNSCTDCSISNVHLSGTGSRAIFIQGPTPRLRIRDVLAEDNNSGGIVLAQVDAGRIENVRVVRSGLSGVAATLTDNTIFKSITVDRSVGVGVSVDQGDDNRLVDIHVGHAGQNGVFLGGNRNVLQHARISCGKGVSISTFNGVAIPTNTFWGRVQDVTTAGCRYGIDMNGASNVVQAITVAATEDVGVRNASYASFLEDAVAIDTTYGLYFLSNNSAVLPQVRSFASSHNQTASVYANNSVLDIGEKLIVGNNGPTANGADCVVAGTTGLDNQCLSSGATLTNGASVLGSIVGITTDATNPQGATSAAPYPDITNFVSFDSDTRRFIRQGGGFPDYAARGPCQGTETCAILDLALKANDTLLKNRNALPTGNDVTTVTWFITANFPADQAACDARVPGSVFVAATPNRCESKFLKHAWELLEDGIGDNDGFCESNETCEFARNIGGYQGHGSFVSAGPFSDGALTGITLVQRGTNGY